MRLLVDLDECVFQFLQELCDRYNQRTGDNLLPQQIHEWDLSKSIGHENLDIFQQKGFFDKLKPFPDAIYTLRLLQQEDFEILLVTNPMGNADIAADKYISIEKHLSFIPKENIIMTARKSLINGDIIIDDCAEYINNFSGIRIVMDRPYNKHAKAHYRIPKTNWLELRYTLHEIRNSKQQYYTENNHIYWN